MAGVEKGHFNYNSDTTEYEIKGADIKTSDLNGYTIISSDVNAMVENCNFSDCKIDGSIILHSIFYDGNEVTHTKIEECVVKRNNIFKESYIDNKEVIFNGEMENCIVRSGVLGTDAKHDDKTEIIKD